MCSSSPYFQNRFFIVKKREKSSKGFKYSTINKRLIVTGESSSPMKVLYRQG
ncbi:hypothetical protein V6Z11_A12G124700 [Gossypium hirsutum]